MASTVICCPRALTRRSAPQGTTAPKAQGPPFHAPLEASTLTAGNGTSQTASSVRPGTSAAVCAFVDMRPLLAGDLAHMLQERNGSRFLLDCRGRTDGPRRDMCCWLLLPARTVLGHAQFVLVPKWVLLPYGVCGSSGLPERNLPIRGRKSIV